MTQNWTIDCFAAGHVAQTDLQSMENNFITIKSQFSGALQPANAVEGLLWHDTTANLLKQYHSGAWVTVYDLGNDRATSSLDCERNVIAGTGLSGGGILTADRTLAHAAHTGEVTGTTALTIAAASVSQGKLKTTLQTDTHTGNSTKQVLSLTGGAYCFLPQVKSNNATQTVAFWLDFETAQVVGTSYITYAAYQIAVGTAFTAYLASRYITASGPVYWVFALLDKDTDKVTRWNACMDHPCYGNGGDPGLVQYPFVNYDKARYQLLVSNPSEEQLEEFRPMALRSNIPLSEFIVDNCEFVLSRSEPWTDRKVTVCTFPDYHDVPIGSPVGTILKSVPVVKDAIVSPLRLI